MSIQFMPWIRSSGLTLAALLFTSLASASDVKVENAWVRATAPGQKVAGAFMDLTASRNLRLVAAETAASRVVELHTMRMDNGVMVMRQVREIELPAGRTVQLKPGGLHVMLIDLVAPIRESTRTPLRLILRDEKGVEQHLEIELEARRPGGMPMHAH